jgi:hypothetical protein
VQLPSPQLLLQGLFEERYKDLMVSGELPGWIELKDEGWREIKEETTTAAMATAAVVGGGGDSTSSSNGDDGGGGVGDGDDDDLNRVPAWVLGWKDTCNDDGKDDKEKYDDKDDGQPSNNSG